MNSQGESEGRQHKARVGRGEASRAAWVRNKEASVDGLGESDGAGTELLG